MTKDYLAKERTLRFKGILCLIVVFAHSNLNYFYAFGPWAVSVFFFISGYVLSLTTKGKDMDAGKIFHKFRNFMLPFLIAAIPYHVMFHFFPSVNDYNSVTGAIKCFFRFEPTVQAGWYIVTLMFLFIIYFIAFKAAKGNSIKILAIMTALYIIYAVYAILVDASWAAETAHIFIIGVAFNLYRDRFEKWFKGKTAAGYTLLLLSYLSIALPFLCYEKEGILFTIGMIVFYQFSPVLFLYFSYQTTIKDPVTAFLGKYSLWIYLFHVGVQYMLMYGLPAMGYQMQWTVITFFLATTAVSIVMALIVGIPYDLINKKLTAKK